MNNSFLEISILILYIFSLLILFLYSLNGFVLLYFSKKYKRESLQTKEIDFSKTVTIQLPIYNEINVVERLINSVCEIEYPKDKLEIQVLDDSTDETSEIIANLVNEKNQQGINIFHIKRNNRDGFKAGALKHGLESAKGDFIAIFDADFIPRKDFLTTTLKYFSSDKIAVVQTRWEHLNEEKSVITKTEAFALDGHFVLEQEVRNRVGFFINFNGTGGIWRKEAILDAGNWQADTLTEDLDLSFRAQLKGWKFIYLRDYTTPAELPIDMISLKAQQFRWTKGAIETAKKTLCNLWNSNNSMGKKLQGTIHLTNNMVFPFVLLTGILNIPFLFIMNGGKFYVIINFMSIFFLAFFSTFLFYSFAQKEIHKNWSERILIFPIFIAGSMGMSVNNTHAFFSGLFNKKSEFVRTPKYSSLDNLKNQKKYRVSGKTSFQITVEVILTIYSLVGVIISINLGEYAALPFHLTYFLGFLLISSLSLKEVFIKK